jgi:hypothetical protein
MTVQAPSLSRPLLAGKPTEAEEAPQNSVCEHTEAAAEMMATLAR